MKFKILALPALLFCLALLVSGQAGSTGLDPAASISGTFVLCTGSEKTVTIPFPDPPMTDDYWTDIIKCEAWISMMKKFDKVDGPYGAPIVGNDAQEDMRDSTGDILDSHYLSHYIDNIKIEGAWENTCDLEFLCGVSTEKPIVMQGEDCEDFVITPKTGSPGECTLIAYGMTTYYQPVFPYVTGEAPISHIAVDLLVDDSIKEA